jgi:hypothetical protein
MLKLVEVDPGVFEVSTVASISGIYHFRVLAKGKTLRGVPFTREQLLTGAVWRGGNQPPPTQGDDPTHCNERFCQLLRCLLQVKGVREYFLEKGIDFDGLAKCLAAFCDDPRRSRGEAILPARVKVAELLNQPNLRNTVRQLLRELDKRGGGS